MNNQPFVDLTSSSPVVIPDSNSNEAHIPARISPCGTLRSDPHFHQSNPNGNNAKRRRLDNSHGAGSSSRHRQSLSHQNPQDVEAVDLTEVNDSSTLSKVLSKQRADAIKAQPPTTAEDNASRSILTAYRCPVCMDVATDATTTVCGHLFCHKCILDTFRFNEERRALEGAGKASRGNCPVCRKVISKIDVTGPRRSLVPLQLKLTTKKRS